MFFNIKFEELLNFYFVVEFLFWIILINLRYVTLLDYVYDIWFLYFNIFLSMDRDFM